MHDTNVQSPKVSEVGNAIDIIFGIKKNWKTDFEIESGTAKIVNYAHNNGMAFIYLK